MKTTPCLCLLLSSVLAVAPLPGQMAGDVAGAPALLPPPASAGLTQLRVIENDGAETAVGSRSDKGITVEVTDAGGAGVPGAAVTLRLPESGPTGTFQDGTHTAIAYTDGTGRALINGIQWSTLPGPVSMRVTATKGTAHAGLLLEERLTEPRPKATAAVFSMPPTPAVSHAVIPSIGAIETLEPLPAPPPPPAAVLPVARSGASGPAIQPGTPAHPQVPAAITAQAQSRPPAVSVVTTGAGADKRHGGKTKWLIAAAIAAGAGGAFMAMHGKGSTPAAAAPGLSIGTPSISIGHP